MSATLSMVKEFHTAFGLTDHDEPYISDKHLNDLRVNLIQEELNELKDALEQGDKVSALDALLDLQYVLDGAFLALGFHKMKGIGFHRVHESNMSKLGEDGKPILREDGKILKGPNYHKVHLQDLIDRPSGTGHIMTGTISQELTFHKDSPGFDNFKLGCTYAMSFGGKTYHGCAPEMKGDYMVFDLSKAAYCEEDPV